jgi:hypothetical protein
MGFAGPSGGVSSSTVIVFSLLIAPPNLRTNPSGSTRQAIPSDIAPRSRGFGGVLENASTAITKGQKKEPLATPPAQDLAARQPVLTAQDRKTSAAGPSINQRYGVLTAGRFLYASAVLSNGRWAYKVGLVWTKAVDAPSSTPEL